MSVWAIKSRRRAHKEANGLALELRRSSEHAQEAVPGARRSMQQEGRRNPQDVQWEDGEAGRNLSVPIVQGDPAGDAQPVEEGRSDGGKRSGDASPARSQVR